MKYKIGDKVRVIKEKNCHCFKNGDIVKIKEIDNSDAPYRCLRNTDKLYQWLSDEDIAPLSYTWEDFEKCPIGTKVTFESRNVLVKDDKNQFENEDALKNYDDFDDFKINGTKYGKITKIEEPTYTTVYEPTEQVEEMTLEEVCKELGREIKIVKEK